MSRSADALAAVPRRGLRIVPQPPQRRGPLTLWHLLSLDAPSVAAVWTLFAARCAHVPLRWHVPAAVFVAVWILYVVDRLLDSAELEERHRFHQRHRARFLAGIAWAAPVLALLMLRVEAPALRLYVLLAGALAAWFTVVHARGGTQRLPKELAVGVFFPAAVFLPTVAAAPADRLLLLPLAMLLAMACTLNCLFLYLWEHPRHQMNAHWTTRWAVGALDRLAVGAIVVAAALTLVYREDLRLLPVSAGLAVGFLLLLHHVRRTLRPLTVRALADAALLSPLLFLPFLHG